MHRIVLLPVVLTLLLAGGVGAGTLEEYAAGRGNLRSLLERHALFILTPSYQGSVSLVYHRGPRKKDAPKKRDLHFTAFTPDAARYGETDCPKPKLPAILEATPLEDHGFGTGVVAFSESAPAVERLSRCTTLKDLQAEVPGLVHHSLDEEEAKEDDTSGFWFNWFQLEKDGQVQVVMLDVHNDAEGRLISMEIWTGTLPPHP